MICELMHKSVYKSIAYFDIIAKLSSKFKGKQRANENEKEFNSTGFDYNSTSLKNFKSKDTYGRFKQRK